MIVLFLINYLLHRPLVSFPWAACSVLVSFFLSRPVLRRTRCLAEKVVARRLGTVAAKTISYRNYETALFSARQKCFDLVVGGTFLNRRQVGRFPAIWIEDALENCVRFVTGFVNQDSSEWLEGLGGREKFDGNRS